MDLSIESCFEALQDRYYVTRANAARALARRGPEAHHVTAALIAALYEPERGLRDIAAEALGNMGPRARAAVPALQVALEAKNGFVRGAAQRALRKIEPDAAR